MTEHEASPMSEHEQPLIYARAVISFTTAVMDTETVEEVLWLLTDDVIADLGFEDCVVYLVDETRQKLVQRAAYGNKKAGVTEILNPIELEIGEGLTGRCAAERQPILVNDLSNDSSYVLDDMARLSELAVPILSGGEIIGVIDSEHSSKNFYTAQHVMTLEALSSIITTRYESSKALRQLEKSQARLHHLAHFDSLSELPNRHHFITSLEQAARRFDDGEVTSVAVLILDLDRFKLINDTYGHATGDELIRRVSERFRDALPESVLVSRLSGDEFAALVTDESSVDAVAVGELLLASIESPISLKAADVKISASIGIAIHKPLPEVLTAASNTMSSTYWHCDATSLMKLADSAMYKAKADGRGHAVLGSVLGETPLLSDLNLEAAINEGLLNNEFEIYLQPLVDLVTEDVIGFESLVRWRHPEVGLVSPMQFIDFAERSGQIRAIDIRVLQQSRQCLDELRRGGREDLSINVNVSASLLSRPDWLDGPTGANFTKGLNVEVTERSVIADMDAAVLTLAELRSRGVRVFIDDFGIGYSSLSYLQLLPCDFIKIDKSFTAGLGVSDVSLSLVKLLVALAEAMDVTLVAEGIETHEQLEIVEGLGVDCGQGYLLAKPMPAAEIWAFLEKGFKIQRD